jgi:CubicO group peptidase (beta-lactamase class C family)
LASLSAAAAGEPRRALDRLVHAPAAARPTLSDPASVESFLDGYAAAAMADQYPPGMLVAVATRERAFVRAYGLADVATGEKATPETLFRIGSISKTFVWTAVMILAEEGAVDLDADVNRYLKTVKVKPKFGAPVTLNDLMAHRPGFEDTLGDFFVSGKGLTFEQALAKTRPARIAPPGERTAYSNWGTELAAQLIADVTGAPYEDFIRTRILAPLGMTATILRDPASVAGAALNDPALDRRLASPHRFEAGAPAVMAHDSLEPLTAAGAVALDAHDAARWLRFFLNSGVAGGERLVSPETFTLMRLRAFRDRTGAPDFAHGFMETEIAGHRTFGHGGALSGFVADMTVVPSLGVGVFVAVNGAEEGRLPDLVSRAVIEAFAGSSNLYPSAAPLADERMKKAARGLAGVYRANRRVETRFEKLAALGADIVISARDDGSIALAAGGRTKRFYPLSEDLWTDRSRDALYVYRNADGSVKRISIAYGTDTAEPVALARSSDGFHLAVGLVGGFSLLALIGAWRRQGREVPTTAAGRWLALGHGAAALVWLAFIGALAWTTADLGAKDLPELQAAGWPPTALVATQIAAHVAAAAALLVAAGLVPVALRSGWTLWRKGHYALFALAGLIAVYALWNWRVILAPTSG